MKTVSVRLVADGKPDQVMTLEEFGALHAAEQEQRFKDFAGKIQEFLGDKATEQMELLAKAAGDDLAQE